MAALEGTVLVVSGDPAVADSLRFGLPAGLETVPASDARAAWKELAEGVVPVAAVVELRTGSSGGFSLARDLNARPHLSNVPIVMLIERDQDRWLAREAGAEVILRKPLEPGELPRAVLSLLAETAPSTG